MTDLPDTDSPASDSPVSELPVSGPPVSGSPEWLAQRRKVVRQRNVALALVLGCFAVLFFAITIVKMKM